MATVMAAAKCLNDYSDGPSKRKTPPSNDNSFNFGNGGKKARVDRSVSGGADKRPFGRDTPQPKTNNATNFKPRQPLACFLCQGPHRVAECQYRGALNALVALSQEGGHSQQSVKEVENEPARMGSIRFFNALHTQLSQLKKEPERGLLYVEVVLNGKTTSAMVDTGATDTFISLEEIGRAHV